MTASRSETGALSTSQSLSRKVQRPNLKGSLPTGRLEDKHCNGPERVIMLHIYKCGKRCVRRFNPPVSTFSTWTTCWATKMQTERGSSGRSSFVIGGERLVDTEYVLMCHYDCKGHRESPMTVKCCSRMDITGQCTVSYEEQDLQT